MAKHRNLEPSVPAALGDDAAEFRAAVRDVKPLVHVTAARPAAKRKPKTRVRSSRSNTTDHHADMPLIEASAVSGIAAADALAFQRAGVQNQVIRRLRRGLIPIEAELDLHGLTQAAARDQLAEFLEVSHALGRRCVRIIHGKGYRSGARGPVLKIAVDTWLRRNLAVIAFTSARTIDGGTGAVYVLLRA